MKSKIHYINRYSTEKKENIKEYSGYEQIVKYCPVFSPIKGNSFLSKIIFRVLNLKKPKDYRKITIGKEIIAFFKALITGNPIFYLYADKDAFLLPLLKRKFKLNRIKLFGTLHWPVENSQEFSFYKHNLEDQFKGIIALSSSLNPTNSKGRCVIPHGINLDYWKNENPGDFINCYLILGISNRNHLGQIEIVKRIKTLDPEATFKLLMQDKTVYEQYKVIPDIEIISERVSDDDLKRLYLKSKAVILVQNHCLASNVVLECISMKIPLITNRVGDIEEYLGKDYPVFLNDELVDEKLNKIVHFPSFRTETVNYLENIRNNFEWKSIAERTVEFIENGG